MILDSQMQTQLYKSYFYVHLSVCCQVKTRLTCIYVKLNKLEMTFNF